jgi:alpha-amylase/alpha-mannosidase (GH57 family)
MHQPYYKDDADGLYYMPWVYLHAIKDYHEMAAHVEKASASGKVKVTFNYVPSLLMQMKDYESVNVSDLFMFFLRKDTSTLSDTEKQALVRQLVMIRQETMASEFKHFENLLIKAKKDHRLTEQELRDMSVLYLLAWTGTYIRQEELPATLIRKGQGFTEAEKFDLLNFLASKIASIVPLHKKLVSSGAAEISATPAFHPILPLLADFTSAREAMPDAPMPNLSGSFGDDWKWHLDEAISTHTETFGAPPAGMWPAEGSVSEKTADYYMERGIKWIATDEDILARSIGANIKMYPQRTFLYRQHYHFKKDKKLSVFFRDKHLSDLIGFTYANWDAVKAVDNFFEHLRTIYDSCDFSPHVSVILDGENAWEYYPHNASYFFEELYKRLAQTDWITMQTMSEAHDDIGSNTPKILLPRIASGSWIYGNFAIWCGHHEKNRAWELLSATRNKMVDKLAQHIYEKDVLDSLYRELHAAEGSDWFWWYGDDHFTTQADLFDRLFRGHLINIYRKLGEYVPRELFEPIKSTAKTGLLRKPSLPIYPILDGEASNFYEWLGAGEFDLSFDEGSMHGGSHMKKLYFGYNEENVCLRINCGSSDGFPNECTLEIEIEELGCTALKLSRGKLVVNDGIICCMNSVIEITIPLRKFFSGANSRGVVFYMNTEAGSAQAIQERAPRYNMVKLELPSKSDVDWIV